LRLDERNALDENTNMSSELELDFGRDHLPEHRIVDPKSQWRVISALQKAIRRSNVEEAVNMAVAMSRHDDRYLFRRMAIIALEDIGLGNLDLTANLLAIAGKTAWRAAHGGPLIAAYFAERLAETPKDRTFCNTACADLFDPSLAVKRDAWVTSYDEDELCAIYADPDKTVMERHIAGLALTGGLTRGKGAEKEYSTRSKEKFFATLHAMGIGQREVDIVKRGMSIAAEGLYVALPIVFPMVKYVEVKPAQLTPVIKIKGVLSSAYDGHVQEGKSAIAYFAKSKPIQEFVKEKFPNGGHLPCISSLVFNVDSISMSPYLKYPFAQKIEKIERELNAMRFGLTLSEFEGWMYVVHENLHLLTEARVRVTK